jgi:CheY-like chemotaxis protein
MRIDVIDTGIGIPKDKFQTIFQEFHQLGNNPRRSEKGVGLGLAIVDRVANLLQAPIEIDSDLGRGSRFSITLQHGQAAIAQPPAPAPSGPTVAHFGTCLVVVIDNDPQILDGMRSLLRSWDCHVIGAPTAEAALLEAPRAPDIVIADYYLDGGAYGTDAVAALRESFGAQIPSLVITSDTSPRLRTELRRAGHAVLNKPVAPSRLRALMSHLLR